MFFKTTEEKAFYALSLLIPCMWYFDGFPVVLAVWFFMLSIFVVEDMTKGNFTEASIWTGALMPIICWGVFIFVDLPKLITRIFRG